MWVQKKNNKKLKKNITQFTKKYKKLWKYSTNDINWWCKVCSVHKGSRVQLHESLMRFFLKDITGFWCKTAINIQHIYIYVWIVTFFVINLVFWLWLAVSFLSRVLLIIIWNCISGHADTFYLQFAISCVIKIDLFQNYERYYS